MASATQPALGAASFVVPAWIDDPARPSGGNVYDRQLANGLSELGWQVTELPTPGAWPCPDAAALQALADRLAAIPDGELVLLDGLIASAAGQALLPHSDRLRLVVLVHLPLGEAGHDPDGVRRAEAAVLRASAAVIATSPSSRQRLVELYDLPPGRVHAAEPGVDAAPLAPGTEAGGEFLCVAAVTAHKGQDVLVAALTELADLPWRCVVVGSLEREPAFTAQVRDRAEGGGIGDRIRWAGPLVGTDLDAAYAAADLLVLASAGETYGMVVTEALARGVPVIASEVGGLPDAMGQADGGACPGLLVTPGDPAAFAAALRRWLTESVLRQRLRVAAGQRRETLTGWSETARCVSRVLRAVSR